MAFQSSYLSKEGDLLNLTWNDTYSYENSVKKAAPSVYDWDDAAWVMSSCFVIFGKFLLSFLQIGTEIFEISYYFGTNLGKFVKKTSKTNCTKFVICFNRALVRTGATGAWQL